MYGEVVDGIDGHRFEDALTELKRDARRRARHRSRRPTTCARWSRRSSAIYREATGERASRRTRASSCCARCAPCSTRGTRRARRSTAAPNEIPDDIGTAVNVVQMVFGNKGDRSGTGVAFTRDPSTGEQGVYGEFLANAQGEDVVAGIRTPQPLEAMREMHAGRLRAAARDACAGSSEHYRDMQDVEFTVEDDKLYMLQTRAAKRTAPAALKARGRHGRRGADLARGGASRASTRRSSTSSCTR